MKPENFYKFDLIIQKWADSYKLPWKLIKAQIWQESNFDPNAVSSCGAKGLMQLMPETDFWLDKDYDGFDVEGNIENGIHYDRWLFDHFTEVEDIGGERLKFMLAAYNGGRGYINKAMEIAYENEFHVPMPQGHRNAKSGFWQNWNRVAIFLSLPECKVQGKSPDFTQIVDYVDRIMFHLLEL